MTRQHRKPPHAEPPHAESPPVEAPHAEAPPAEAPPAEAAPAPAPPVSPAPVPCVLDLDRCLFVQGGKRYRLRFDEGGSHATVGGNVVHTDVRVSLEEVGEELPGVAPEPGEGEGNG